MHGRAVDVADAAFDAGCYAHRTVDVPAKDCRGEAILGVVGDPHGFIDAAHADNGDHRAE
ncbi:hypothetical protein D3C72_2184790 [compost metagenome]